MELIEESEKSAQTKQLSPLSIRMDNQSLEQSKFSVSSGASGCPCISPTKLRRWVSRRWLSTNGGRTPDTIAHDQILKAILLNTEREIAFSEKTAFS